jgi:hypothetical protein
MGIIPVALAVSETEQESKTEYYHVVGNKVDGNTFLGWRQYESACISCHGTGATGSDIATDLTTRISYYNPVEFETKVLQRYVISIPGDEIKDSTRTAFRESILAEISKKEMRDRGELETMPQWHHNPAVKERIQGLYGYLKARSDGAIGPDDRLEILSE